MPMTRTDPLPGRPIAPPTTDSEPFWRGAYEGELRVQRCADCGNHVFYPRVICPVCHRDELVWTRLSGRGQVWSFTIVERPVSAAFRDALPYVVALVELAEGPKLMTNVVDCDPYAVAIGMQVEVVFEEIDDARSLPLFGPASTTDESVSNEEDRG